MKKLFVGLSIAVLMTGCSGGRGGGDSTPGWTTTNSSLNPVILTKQDKNCVGTFSTDDEAEFFLTQFINGTKVLNQISFGSQLNGNYVESIIDDKPISQTNYGKETNITALLKYDEIEQEYVLKSEADFTYSNTEAQKLDVCPGTTNYASFTFEESGLNISNSITKTYEAIKEANELIKLDPVTVEVAPVTYKDIKFLGGPNNRQQSKGYDTDNAFYQPDEKSITFLPQSKEYQDLISDTPFWQIPMVASHEFGHHVFQTLIINKTTSSMKHTESCFQNHTTLKNKYLEAKEGERDNGIEFAMGSINEGFADLIAYYALDEKERGLKGVQCFTLNREVESSMFGSFVQKYFDSSALSLINDTEAHKADTDCDTPDYQEIHDVGAMFAHGVNRLISLKTNDKNIKMKIILSWAEQFAAEYDSLKSLKAGEVFFASLELMYKTAIDITGNTVDVYDCLKINKIFPDSHGYECRYLDTTEEKIFEIKLGSEEGPL